ncbi:MAG: hypothetical protein ACJ8HU_09450 [Chthoniobacterales bacterium]
MRRFHTLFFATLCGGFVLVGGWKLCTSLKPELPSIGDASFSSDRDIEGLCGIDHGSERIRQTLAALPSKKRLVILLPAHDASSAYFASLVGYAAWPRQVDAIEIDPRATVARVRALNPKTFAAILFLRLPPPPFVPRGVRWASGLTFVPSPAGTETTP